MVGGVTGGGTDPPQVGMVARGEVQIAPSSFYLTNERATLVDFSRVLILAE